MLKYTGFWSLFFESRLCSATYQSIACKSLRGFDMLPQSLQVFSSLSQIMVRCFIQKDALQTESGIMGDPARVGINFVLGVAYGLVTIVDTNVTNQDNVVEGV